MPYMEFEMPDIKKLFADFVPSLVKIGNTKYAAVDGEDDTSLCKICHLKDVEVRYDRCNHFSCYACYNIIRVTNFFFQLESVIL